MKRCGYGRVSTDRQENSLENQMAWFEKLGVEKVFTDSDVSGTKLNRPGFGEMLTRCGLRYEHKQWEPDEYRNSEFSEIVVKQTNRFARNTDVYNIIKALRVKGCAVNFIEDNINTRTNERDFFFQLLTVFDMNDSRDKSTKVKFGHERGKERGIVHSNRLIYGYDFSDGKLTIIPHEAEVIRLIYNLALTIGVRRTREYLEDNKILTRQGKFFAESTIKGILGQEKYAGLDNRGKWDCGEVFASHHPKAKKNYTVQPNPNIPVIIDMETFNKTREAMKSRLTYVDGERKFGLNHAQHQYAKKLVCNCGSNFYYRIIKPKGHEYYVCGRKIRFGFATCESSNISGRMMETIIDQVTTLYPLRFDEMMNREIAFFREKTEKAQNEIDISKDEEIKVKQAEIEVVKGKYSRLLDLDDDESDEVIKEKIEAFKRQIEGLKKEIEELSDWNNCKRLEIANCGRQINRLNQLYHDRKESYTREEMKEKINKITVFHNYVEVDIDGLIVSLSVV